MKKMIATLVLMAAALIATASPLFAEDVYVQSMRAKVMAEASFKAKMIAEVNKGYKLTVLAKSGNWVKVKYGSFDGFVSALLVSNVPPMEKQTIIKGDEIALQTNVRRRASTYTSAAAARGLAADDRRRLSKEEKSDYDALDRMESFVVGDAEVLKFMEETKP